MACRFAPCSTTNTLYRPFAGNSEMRQLIGDYSVQELSDSAQQHGGLGYINLGNSTVDGGAEQRHHPRAAELLPNSQKCKKPVYSGEDIVVCTTATGRHISMAEREGFEPPDGLTRQRFSRPPHSTTLPPLRCTLQPLAFTKRASYLIVAAISTTACNRLWLKFDHSGPIVRT